MSEPIAKRLDVLDQAIEKVEKLEEHLEKIVEKEQRELELIESEEIKIEKSLVQVGGVSIKRSHLLEVARGAAGAFLGVGLGQALGGSVNLAKTLPWLNTFGILIFVLLLVSVLIYKNDKDVIAKERHKHPVFYITQKLAFLYIISLCVQLLGLILFNSFPGWNPTLIKALIIGSYSAMSSAVAFTLI
ncbi:MAG: hypothetical protein ACR2LN_07405 [Candidatus Levyibacteriota bacterium]